LERLEYIPLTEFQRVRELPVTPVTRARLIAEMCRINALYMITKAGSGHIGSSFSCMDIVAWLFLNELNTNGARDIYFSSKGHDAPGLYAVLTGLGLLDFESIHRLRRLNGLPGHPDISIPYMVTNTGSLGMGISKAKGMAAANRLRGQRGRIFVLTGDGELQEGQIWESLASAANHGMGEITVIVDHNKIQSDTWVARVSDLGDLERKFSSFGWHALHCDGNDAAAFATALEASKGIVDRPKVIIADTVKGCGVAFMAYDADGPDEALYAFHSGAPDHGTYERAAEELVARVNHLLKPTKGAPLTLTEAPWPRRPDVGGHQRLVRAYAEALVEQAAHNPRIVALDADLMLDCGLVPFRRRFPERFIECGIAEQDMVSQAGGLAVSGMLPVVHSFACFLSTRPNEQIYNNATERRKVVYVGSLAGLLPGGPGHSHQSVRDISALAAVPGLAMVEPRCEWEVAALLDYCLNELPDSVYLRLISPPCDVPYALPASYRVAQGRGVALTEGGDAVMIAYGPVTLAEACKAAAALARDHGIGLRVVNLPWLNRVDAAWLRGAVDSVNHVFTVDNHYVTGGQGQMIAATLAQIGRSQTLRLHTLGVRDIPCCGRNDEVLSAHGLDASSLTDKVLNAMTGARQAVELLDG
jgi:transketolase